MTTIEFRSVCLDVDSAGNDSATILGPVDLTLSEHRIGVIGANGSGKSTLRA